MAESGGNASPTKAEEEFEETEESEKEETG